eukprot:GGOE01007369.1.p1 GENE.GGOE01007369.1~~GGOE01007369.1.p1  ORF type:complete len:517 (-),score=153.81 GGOE01007369.1:1219-2730(-)
MSAAFAALQAHAQELAWLKGVNETPRGQGSPVQGSDQKLGTNVYISRLPKTITQDQLERLFQRFGPIISCRVVYHTQGKQGRVPRDPVGFVQFLHPDVAQKAIAQVNGMPFEGKRLVVRMADQDKDKGITSAPSDNLYIANLPKHFREPDLHAIFSQFGTIVDLVVLKHLATGQSKGSGMVRFSTVEEASRAKETLNCARLPGLDYPLEVKFAESKEDKVMRQKQKQSAQAGSHEHSESASGMEVTSSKGSPFSLCSGSFSDASLTTPTTPLQHPPASTNTAAALTALEDYLKTMLPSLAPSPSPSRQSSIWERRADAVEGSESELWDKTTYGYSSDSNSDGQPISPVESPLERRPQPPISKPVSPPLGPKPSTTTTVTLFNLPLSTPVLVPSPLTRPMPVAPSRPSPSPVLSPLLSSPTVSREARQGLTRLRIANLPPHTTQLHLYQLCARYGAILGCALETVEDGAVAAWLQFKKVEEAAQVEQKLDGQMIQGRTLRVQLC